MDAQRHVHLLAVTTVFALLTALASSPTAVRAQDAPPPEAGDGQPSGDRAPADREAVQLTSPGTTMSVTVGTSEVRSLAGKLEEFGKGLSPEERLMMDWLFQRAASAPQDDPASTPVHGMLFTPPRLAGGAAEAAGLDPRAGPPAEGDEATAGDGAMSEGIPPGGASGGVEETTAISPAPPAALARALGMNLLQMERAEGATPAGTRPEQ